jgi:hypothetical protein
MDYAYSPYKENRPKKPWFKTPKIPKINMSRGVKMWLGIILGVIIAIFLIIYLLMGQLRFFANHFLGLTFFNKNYLIVLQNNYELRPGGGFITGYGNLNFTMGIPGGIKFANSYDIDTTSYVTPPYPQEEMLKNEWYQGYTFRDANWDADSRNNATQLIDFYQKKFPGKDVDGIFVINFSLIEDLVDSLGGIDLNGKKLTKENLFSELEFQVNNVDRHNVDALSGRKSILSDIAAQLISKAKFHPFKMRDVLTKGLNNKSFYIWLKDDGLENKLIEKGWSDTLVPAEKSDFLAVNLANLGSKKADRYLQTEAYYYANITKEIPEITTEISLRYPGFTNSYSDNYKGYLRIYIPKNADVTSAPVDSDTKTEGEFKVIGAKVILPAGSKMDLTYVYTLPRTAFALDEYKLRVVKQSGSAAFYNLTVETPDGKFAQSDDFETRENRALFIGQLQNDKDFSLKILPDTTPPYPTEQEFTDLTHVNIVWDEPMDATSVSDVNNYSFTDLNKTDAVHTDVVKVAKAEVIQPNVVQLELEGTTKQDLEQYRIDLKEMKDAAGNLITPDPKSITVVQRFQKKTDATPIKFGDIPAVPNIEQPAQ